MSEAQGLKSRNIMAKADSAAAPPGRRDSAEIVVFWIRRPTVCAECREELFKGNSLRLEAERPLCLSCADLDHLVFLPSGDAALTRRAKRASRLWAVVVRYSVTRNRYERQGLLVEEQALARAEQECLGDAEARRLTRERATERRQQLDDEYVAAFASRIGDLFPGCPAGEQRAIAEHACRKYSGRIGRSADAKALDATAIELAVRAHIRHMHTNYDDLLARGAIRGDARDRVAAAVATRLEEWQRA